MTRATLTKKMKPLLWLAVLVAVVILLRLTVFRPPKVRTVRLEKRDLVAQVYGNGTVEAKVVVNVASKITGRLLSLAVDQGETVQRGQVLATLDDSELRDQMRQTKAGVDKARALVAVANATRQKARANLVLAKKNSQRFTALAAKDLVAAQEAEQYATAMQVAREDEALALAAIEAARRDEIAATAALGASTARLADTQILAPADGIIIRRDLEPGATVTAGLPIFLMADPKTVWLEANVDEALLQLIAPGQVAAISLRSAPEVQLPGQVARIAKESDRVTEELVVDVAFVPPLATFHLGEQADVLITASSRQGVPALPWDAVVSHDNQRGVWTVAEGRLQFKPVTIGIEDRQGFVEVTDGLGGQETVVLATAAELLKFSNGQKVRVRK
jgi:HlyD family secretion protein